MKKLIMTLGLGLLASLTAPGAGKPSPVTRMWAGYFESETARIAERCLAAPGSRADWEREAPEFRRQLREMLGLDPWPERTPLQPVVTGTVDHEEFTVDKVYFQSSPGLYVTGNLYVPKARTGRVPAILYVSGHGPSKKNGVSFGNKVSYQHHGAWFARHGYVCLIIDTIQMGEIEGLHHGTYREGLWWWNSRGYTPAGVEAWNSIRAIDYLQSRPEVDAEKIGMTGRSGGGAYSWWTAAIDERVKAVAPVAGITDLQNHVVDGAVEGHCDCMFMVNTHEWDYAQVAALVAPRPLLIGNTDRDPIFPLDGVVRVHREVAGIYQLLNAETNLALLITEGPHKDTQDLQVPVMRWFNRFLKGEDPLIRVAAEKFFEPEQLKVFASLPEDQIVTRIHDIFVPTAPPPILPANRTEWQAMKDRWLTGLREQVFAGWPDEEPATTPVEVANQRSGTVRLRVFELETQPGLSMPLAILEPRNRNRRPVEFRVLGHADWQAAMAIIEERFGVGGLSSTAARTNESAVTTDDGIIPTEFDRTLVLFAPRGAGRTAPELDERGFIQFRRRFMLLGQTLDGMRVWDIRRALQFVQSEYRSEKQTLALRASGPLTVDTLLASCFELAPDGLHLGGLPVSFQDGPDFLNVLKVIDMPSLLAIGLVDRVPPTEAGPFAPGLVDYAALVQNRLGSASVK